MPVCWAGSPVRRDAGTGWNVTAPPRRDAAARHRELFAAGRLRAARGTVLHRRGTAHRYQVHTNREPDVARKLIDSDERIPLTLEEGLAIATQHPGWLQEKNGFNLLGSRSADGRVSQHLAEPERPEARCGVAEFQAHVAWQRILHGPQGRLAVPLVSGLRGLSGPCRLPADLLPLLSI